MPQVDLETLVGSVCSGGGCSDRKITCETLAVEDNQNQQKLAAESDQSSDLPPESFWLSKDAELDWVDRNAFIARQGSTRGSSFNSTNSIPGFHPNTAANSQRYSNLKSKSSIIGLPKPQNSCFVDAKSRPHTNMHLFPKRSSSSVAEPGSPKVSCMGRVRSKRDRHRRLRNRQRSKRSTDQPELKKVKSVRRRESESSGFMASIRSIFKTRSKSKKHTKKSESGDSSRKSKAAARANDIRDRFPAPEIEAPRKKSGGKEVGTGSFGGMMKFSSGRRSEDWACVIDVA